MLGMAWCVPCEGGVRASVGHAVRRLASGLGHAIDAGMHEFVRVEVQFTFLSKEDTVPCRKAIAADHLPPVSFTMICLSSARASSTTWPPTGCIRAVELPLISRGGGGYRAAGGGVGGAGAAGEGLRRPVEARGGGSLAVLPAPPKCHLPLAQYGGKSDCSAPGAANPWPGTPCRVAP